MESIFLRNSRGCVEIHRIARKRKAAEFHHIGNNPELLLL